MELHHLEGRARSSELDRMVDNAKRASDFLKALAHESRLMILCILAEGEKSVSELEDLLRLRQPTVSQQLARLRADGLVSTRRDGKAIYYKLASDEARIVIGAIYAVFCRTIRKRSSACFLIALKAPAGLPRSYRLSNRPISQSIRKRGSGAVIAVRKMRSGPANCLAFQRASQPDSPQPETRLRESSRQHAACAALRSPKATVRRASALSSLS